MNKIRPIPQCDPKANYLACQNEIEDSILRVLNSGKYILNTEVEKFETEFASFLNAPYAVGVASGTDALELSLRVCGIGAGDLVITVSHTAVATVAAIERTGALPLFVDIDPETYTMDPDSLETLLKKSFPQRPKAVIPVHLYGHPADMTHICQIAEQYGLYVIEDCAQAHGASLDGKMLGTWCHLGAFSFYPTKNLSALGDGGAIVTDSQEIYTSLMAMREYGWQDRYRSVIKGVNSRLDEIQAAILRVKLKYLDQSNQKRIEIAEKYRKSLHPSSYHCPDKVGKDVQHVYHQFVIRTQKRNNVIDFLHQHHIGSAIHYPVPVHLQPAYKNYFFQSLSNLPCTEKICNEILSLPMFPEIREKDINRICDTLLLFQTKN